jgi:hypothetical protein
MGSSGCVAPARCRLCDRGPALQVRFHQGVGMLVLHRHRWWSGPLCRECGLSVGGVAQRRTLAVGWWGIWSVLANPIYLVLNHLALRKVSALPEPGYVEFPRPAVRIVGATPAAAAAAASRADLAAALN